MDNYVVISEKALPLIHTLLELGKPDLAIRAIKELQSKTIPAKELWDAAREQSDYMFEFNDLTDFLTTKFNNDGE